MTIADRVRAIVDTLPAGAAVTLPSDALRAWLEDEAAAPAAPSPIADADSHGWRERIWLCPAETRLGVREVAEALDRSADFVYRAADAKWSEKRGRDALPCSKLDGALVFTAGSLRHWLETSAVIVNPEPPRVQLHTRRRA